MRPVFRQFRGNTFKFQQTWWLCVIYVSCVRFISKCTWCITYAGIFIPDAHMCAALIHNSAQVVIDQHGWYRRKSPWLLEDAWERVVVFSCLFFKPLNFVQLLWKSFRGLVKFKKKKILKKKQNSVSFKRKRDQQEFVWCTAVWKFCWALQDRMYCYI